VLRPGSTRTRGGVLWRVRPEAKSKLRVGARRILGESHGDTLLFQVCIIHVGNLASESFYPNRQALSQPESQRPDPRRTADSGESLAAGLSLVRVSWELPTYKRCGRVTESFAPASQ
jgi:hypothetical protein